MDRPTVNAPLELTMDHLHCYRDGQIIFPLIQDEEGPISPWAHAVVVRLAARSQDDLNWTAALQKARQLIEQGKWILWEFDFGLGQGSIDLGDQTTFYSYTVAVEEFTSKLWKEFSGATLGVIIYRGDSRWSERICNVQARYAEEREGEGSPLDLDLYSASLIADYLHRLVSFFPDTVLPFALIDLDDCASSHARNALIFSKNRFEHIHFAIRGSSLPFSGLAWQHGSSLSGWIGLGERMPGAAPSEVPKRGVCLPQERYCDGSLVSSLAFLLDHLIETGQPFRLIAEERLTEEWNDVDQLIYFPDQTSAQGKRMLKGFFVAGGEAIDADTLLSTLCAEEN